MNYFPIQREEDCIKKILSLNIIKGFLEGYKANFLLRGILLLFLKIASVSFEYVPPFILTQYEESAEKYLLVSLALYVDFFTQKYYGVYLSELQYLVNAKLSQKLFSQCLKVHNQTTFQGMLKELRQVEKAIRSFYDLVAIAFELPFVYHLLKNESLFDSIKYGVILSLFALLAASVAQIYAWRIQFFSDKRLRLTQDMLCGIKSIKYLQWENVMLKLINKVREQEFLGNKGIQYVDTFVTFFRRMTQIVLLFVAFYKLQELEKEQFYTILIFFDKLVSPINSFPWCFGEFLGSIFSVIKLYDYFNTTEVEAKLIKENTIEVSSIKKIRIFDRVINFIKGDSFNQATQTRFQVTFLFKEIKRNKLTCIIGQIGSGKSILLEYFCDGSYVSQNSWLFTGTVRQNILFGQKYDEQRYQQCLKLAAIDFDDNKQVGFNGTNLSGGQKQRVTFCRALYYEAQSYYFDDIFSAVDENVADHMFKSITTFLKGKTVVLVLNQLQYLQYVDFVIKIENNIATLEEMQNFQVGSVHFSPKPITDAIEPAQPEKEIDQETEQNLKENYQFYINALGLKTLLFFVICSLLHQIMKGGFELWIHNNISNLKNFDKSEFLNVFLILSGLTLLRGFSYSYATIISAKNIFDLLMQKFIHLPTKFYDIFSSSFYIRRLFDDMNEIDDLPLNYFFTVSLEFLGLFILISSMQIEIIPYVIISGYLLVKNQLTHRKFIVSRQVEINRHFETQDFDSFIIETEKGHKFIKYFRQENKIQSQFQKILLYKYANALSQSQLEYTLKLRNFIVESTVLVLLIITGNKLSYTYAYLLFGNQFLSKSVSSWRRITIVSQSLQRIKQIVSFPQEQNASIQEYKDNLIVYDNVWLSYGMAKGLASADYALKGVSFQISKGQKVAFCGRTGSGKSSLFNLLVSLYEFQKGQIYFFGNPISHYGTTQLRSTMSVIPQQGVILPGSIRQNIDPNQQFSNQEIEDIFKELDFQIDLNKDTQNLSNGEKQIVNFVQSILLNRDIILMDEATSNMDIETNNKIMKKLFNFVQDKTLLLISHRLENLQQFDKVYVMGEGQIQASGTYEELLKNDKFLELKSIL
ncbi:unnamed protein product [Paramecium octaurelia]|uniref:ABC transporter domain-containing protein n=1 Tax=Paramecium octaurelia TaxID=43137 RepID=A0A8S1S4X6_PAROT|nr:unnamed protein product [Paramecium octaurelia]